MEDFAVWYRDQYSRVLAACVALAEELDVAQEGTDEAFARAFQRWKQVSVMSVPGGWVQAVALNQTRRLLRRRRLERLLTPSRQKTARFDHPVIADADVWDEVRRLPARQQTAVILRYVHDLSEAAVADAMGISRGAVSASLTTARAKLRVSLGDPISKEPLHG